MCSLRALKWSMITRDSFDSKHHWMKERPQDFLRFTYSKWEEQPQCLAETPKKSSLSEERPESRWRPGLISSQVSPHFHGSRKSCFNRKHSRKHKGWKGQAPWLLLFFLTCLFLITLPLCETKPHLYNITARDGWEERIWKGCGRDHSLCATWGLFWFCLPQSQHWAMVGYSLYGQTKDPDLHINTLSEQTVPHFCLVPRRELVSDFPLCPLL